MFQGTDRHMKLTGQESAGQLTVYESTCPGGVGHPMHIHHDASESFFLLEGSAGSGWTTIS